MKRFHLSDNRNLKVKFENELTETPSGKPRGFWYSVDLDWVHWLVKEGYENDSSWLKQNLYHVEINDSKILAIRNLKEFDEFENKYVANESYSSKVKWNSVASKYAGLEIAPYLWSKRLNSFWYCGWDCASGVIWNKEGLKNITLIETKGERIVKLWKEKYKD